MLCVNKNIKVRPQDPPQAEAIHNAYIVNKQINKESTNYWLR